MTHTKQRAAFGLVTLLFFIVIAGCGTVGGATPSATSSATPSAASLPISDGENAELFANGNFAFIQSYESSPDACKTQLSIIERNGKKALLADVSNGGTPYLAIDVSSLLGEDVSNLRSMEIDVETTNPDGEFYAVSGTITALSGADRLQGAPDPWSVYLAAKNPNIARAALNETEYMISGAYNMFIFSKEVDNALTGGAGPTNFIILGIRFYGENGAELTLNTDAVFSAPEGFGRPDRSNLLETSGETTIDGSSGNSPGGWGQAVAITTIHGGGAFDASVIAPGSVITVYYASESAPELILQSWSGGEGLAKAAPAYVNDSGTIAQFLYDDIITAFNSNDLEGLLDQLYAGDTGEKLDVYAMSVATVTGGDTQ
ncbi:MAG: hypothetical protein LBN43_07955 [Oscillospiraceae bacterium]|jgi:hypothetical protein|nr:hypothetical protein [Oscillospiraceae bacterium]